MPFSPCCKRKYSKPCKCNSPCDNCECVVQRGQCPPPLLPSTTEEDDAASLQLYTPVIAATPVSKKCCCCEVKPKKSFWQQLFGDRKCCCSPSPKKKPDCACKPKRKQRCVPECTNVVCCSDTTRLSTPPSSKPCKPVCCCKKVNKCKPNNKPCCPSPGSIFGCHFYCNVENRENNAVKQSQFCKTKQSRRKCCCCCRCCPTETTTTDCTTEDEKIVSSYKYTNNDEPPCPSLSLEKRSFEPIEEPTRKKPERREEFPRKPETPQHIDKPTHSNFHIGLTFTNTETKYYTNNSACSPKREGRECDDENEGSSSEQIITLEIHESNDNIDQGKNKTHTSKIASRDEESASISSKRRKLSSFQEDNEKEIRNSERYSQDEEIFSVEDGKVRKDSMKERSSGALTRSREKRTKNSVISNNDDLGKNVSEILRRLRTIESKINSFNSKKTGNNNKIKHYESTEKRNYKTNTNGESSRKPDAVIEIRKSRSKSYSPARNDSSTHISRYRYSRSLDRGTRSQREQPKVVIKLPHGNKFSDGFVSMTSNKREDHLDYRDSEWMEVSNELKNRKQMKTPCYCYECVCKRAACR